ncbi:hypothetical protein Rhopal_003742-T1 [Rhodotorula paludigena]|uniref:DUF7729 domain-containing protein n=1 Tax=Rhodotorula paludigena TaxID=86838 RepID=A0AAV5GPY0_9BASI|nr:hypothetical protein Rhopal_003742-T1 [Rhodotorula paludigena]
MLARAALASTALLAASTAVSAQSTSAGDLLSGVSNQCIQAVSSLALGSEFATCSSFSSLLTLATTSGSVIDPINSWLENLCSQEDCSDAAIQNATAVINQGCADSTSAIVTTGRSVVANFNQVKEGLCLQYTSNSTFCVTDLLTNLQTALGQDLSISSLTNLDTSSLTSVPSSAVCTDCTHGLVTKLSSALESDSTVSSNNGTITDALASYCGDSFTDGEVPDSVREASANSTNNSNVTSQPLNGASIAAAGVWKAAGGALLGVAGLVALA